MLDQRRKRWNSVLWPACREACRRKGPGLLMIGQVFAPAVAAQHKSVRLAAEERADDRVLGRFPLFFRTPEVTRSIGYVQMK